MKPRSAIYFVRPFFIFLGYRVIPSLFKLINWIAVFLFKKLPLICLVVLSIMLTGAIFGTQFGVVGFGQASNGALLFALAALGLVTLVALFLNGLKKIYKKKFSK